jgi:DNA polymerase III subunit epsilon
MRCVVLDTETTGLETRDGHRIIEIGAVELLNRRRTGRRFHHYLQPDREVDAGAFAVHGIDTAFLADKPRFADIAGGFIEFIAGAELVIHNAAFDVAFIDHELRLLDPGSRSVDVLCRIVDTLGMARQLHPGQRNSLDALCRRYGVDNSGRELHGALLDAEILADVYLAMTGGQVSLSLGGRDGDDASGPGQGTAHRRELSATRPRLRVIAPDDDELEAHRRWVARLDDALGRPCDWHRVAGDGGGARR